MITENCRLCDGHKETVMHILSGCKVLAGSKVRRSASHGQEVTI